nr:vegetative cell wall protein gp1-like [Procambarus clarkii]
MMFPATAEWNRAADGRRRPAAVMRRPRGVGRGGVAPVDLPPSRQPTLTPLQAGADPTCLVTPAAHPRGSPGRLTPVSPVPRRLHSLPTEPLDVRLLAGPPSQGCPGPFHGCPGPSQRCPGPSQGCPGPSQGCPGPTQRCPGLSRGCPGPFQGCPGPSHECPKSSQECSEPSQGSPPPPTLPEDPGPPPLGDDHPHLANSCAHCASPRIVTSASVASVASVIDAAAAPDAVASVIDAAAAPDAVASVIDAAAAPDAGASVASVIDAAAAPDAGASVSSIIDAAAAPDAGASVAPVVDVVAINPTSV